VKGGRRDLQHERTRLMYRVEFRIIHHHQSMDISHTRL